MPTCKGADHLNLPPPLPFVNASIVQTVPTPSLTLPQLPPPPPVFASLVTWTGWRMSPSLHFSTAQVECFIVFYPHLLHFNFTSVFPVLLGNFTATVQATGNM